MRQLDPIMFFPPIISTIPIPKQKKKMLLQFHLLFKRFFPIIIIAVATILVKSIAGANRNVPSSPTPLFPYFRAEFKTNTYQTNVNDLLTNLNSKAINTTFYSGIAGDGTTELAYGLFMCRDDVPASACASCVTTATAFVTPTCPYDPKVSHFYTCFGEAFVWYDDCYVHYSDENFVGALDANRVRALNCSERRAAAGDDDCSYFSDFMSRVVVNATETVTMFAVGAESKSHGLAQCTVDITSEECKECLDEGLRLASSGCDMKAEWNYFSSYCRIQFVGPPPAAVTAKETAAPSDDRNSTAVDSSQRKNAIVYEMLILILGLLQIL